MIDYWLIFNILKHFVDIIVQTYIETLRGDQKKEEAGEEKVFPPREEGPKGFWFDRKRNSVKMDELK